MTTEVITGKARKGHHFFFFTSSTELLGLHGGVMKRRLGEGIVDRDGSLGERMEADIKKKGKNADHVKAKQRRTSPDSESDPSLRSLTSGL